MRILLTNDDGIYAPGLIALAEELPKLGTVEICAPATQQSGVGHSITYLTPLFAEEHKRDGEHFGWAVHGSPADCVKLGLLEFCKERPDILVSGINSGSNVGLNVLYSGTVAAAIEGAFFGIPSFAVSLAQEAPPDYDQTAKLAVDLIRQLVDQGIQEKDLWNLNFPSSSKEGPKGVKFVPMGVDRADETIEHRTDPRGRSYYWSGNDPFSGQSKLQGTDVGEMVHGYVTVTPLKFDMTDHQKMSETLGSPLSLPATNEKIAE